MGSFRTENAHSGCSVLRASDRCGTARARLAHGRAARNVTEAQLMHGTVLARTTRMPPGALRADSSGPMKGVLERHMPAAVL